MFTTGSKFLQRNDLFCGYQQRSKDVKEEIRRMISEIKAQHQFRTKSESRPFRMKEFLTVEECHTLRNWIDVQEKEKGSCTNDFQIEVSPWTLFQLIGKRFFFTNMIKLRKLRPEGWINFHLDQSRQTLQVVLNSDTEYVGGRHTFASKGKLYQPRRNVGDATWHDNSVVHGVSNLVSGIRYSLFLILV